MDMNDHALAVDVGDLEVAHLSPAQPGRIEHHQHGADASGSAAESMSRATSSWTEYGLGSRLRAAWGKECDRADTGRRRVLTKRNRRAAQRLCDRASRQLPIPKQVRLLGTRRIWPGPRRARASGGSASKNPPPRGCSSGQSLSESTTLEFIQHQLPKMGHSEPPCDPHPIPARRPLGGLRRSARRASDLVQTP